MLELDRRQDPYRDWYQCDPREPRPAPHPLFPFSLGAVVQWVRGTYSVNRIFHLGADVRAHGPRSKSPSCEKVLIFANRIESFAGRRCSSGIINILSPPSPCYKMEDRNVTSFYVTYPPSVVKYVRMYVCICTASRQRPVWSNTFVEFWNSVLLEIMEDDGFLMFRGTSRNVDVWDFCFITRNKVDFLIFVTVFYNCIDD